MPWNISKSTALWEREQSLTLIYQELLDKCEIHKRSLAHYCKSQDSTTTTETKTKASKKTTKKQKPQNLKLTMISETTIQMSTIMERPVTDRSLPIGYEADALYMNSYAQSSNVGNFGQCVAVHLHLHMQVRHGHWLWRGISHLQQLIVHFHTLQYNIKHHLQIFHDKYMVCLFISIPFIDFWSLSTISRPSNVIT